VQGLDEAHNVRGHPVSLAKAHLKLRFKQSSSFLKTEKSDLECKDRGEGIEVKGINNVYEPIFVVVLYGKHGRICAGDENKLLR
jgi:hypothetical protein